MKKLLGKGVVEWAFTLETRNSALAGAIDGRLTGKERERANQLLKELGPDRFELEFEKKFGKVVDTVENSRKFWNRR